MILLLSKLQLLWLSSMGHRVFHRWKPVTAVYVFFSESAGPWCLDTLCSFASDSPGTVHHCPSLTLENRNIDILSPLMPASYALRHDLFLNVELFQIYYIKNNENGSVKVTGRNQANHYSFQFAKQNANDKWKYSEHRLIISACWVGSTKGERGMVVFQSRSYWSKNSILSHSLSIYTVQLTEVKQTCDLAQVKGWHLKPHPVWQGTQRGC